MTFFIVSLTIAWVLTLNGRELRELVLFLTTEDVVMHCTCECVAALLLEEKPQEMEIEVFLSVCLFSV